MQNSKVCKNHLRALLFGFYFVKERSIREMVVARAMTHDLTLSFLLPNFQAQLGN